MGNFQYLVICATEQRFHMINVINKYIFWFFVWVPYFFLVYGITVFLTFLHLHPASPYPLKRYVLLSLRDLSTILFFLGIKEWIFFTLIFLFYFLLFTLIFLSSRNYCIFLIMYNILEHYLVSRWMFLWLEKNLVMFCLERIMKGINIIHVKHTFPWDQ